MYIFRIIDMENIHGIVFCEILPTKEQQELYDRLSERYVSFYLIFVKQKHNLCVICNFHQDPPLNAISQNNKYLFCMYSYFILEF